MNQPIDCNHAHRVPTTTTSSLCNLSEDELIHITDEMMNRCFSNGKCTKMSFWRIPLLRKPEILQTLAKYPDRWIPLHKLTEYLDEESRFPFWKMVFKCREYIPQKALFEVWDDCRNDKGNLKFQYTTERHGYDQFCVKDSESELQLSLLLVDPMFLDNPLVIKRCCQVNKQGWQELQYIIGRRSVDIPLSETMEWSIRENDLTGFYCHIAKNHRKISFSLLTKVINNVATNIFRYILEEKLQADAISLHELCCYLTTQFPDNVSVPLLAILDEIQPGIIKNFRDAFQRNLLWYTIQNKKTKWQQPDCNLTKFLLEHGCDPLNENPIGLRWLDVHDRA